MNIYTYIIVGMSASFLLCAGLLLLYFRYSRNILRQQFKMQEAEIRHQKDMLGAIITSQEQERSRIGMELHDEVGASLSSLRLLIDSGLPASDIQNVSTLKQRIDAIIDSVRNIAHDLSPRIKGEYGFYDAIHEFCDTILLSGKIDISLNFTGKEAEAFLQDDKALAIYRVLCELVNNTIRHTPATHIEITFNGNDSVYEIDYRDNGTGLQEGPVKRGLGLHNIESRLEAIGATYVLCKNTPGFMLLITIPLKI